MEEKILKRFRREMRLNACLKSIREACETASLYFDNEYVVYDFDEFSCALSCAADYTKEIDEIVGEIIDAYEEEIRELENEQLQ